MENTQGRWFFGSDQDCHWYLIPLDLKEVWDELTQNDIDPDDETAWGQFEKLFEKHRLDGGIHDFSFTDPKEND